MPDNCTYCRTDGKAYRRSLSIADACAYSSADRGTYHASMRRWLARMS